MGCPGRAITHSCFQPRFNIQYTIDGDIFVRGVGVGFTHTAKLLIKKLRIARETGDLEAETGKEPKKPDIGRLVESYFNLPNEYSSSIILTDSNFLLTNRTCAIAITADMSFKTALAADFKREYKDMMLTALINILGHDNRGDRPTEVY